MDKQKQSYEAPISFEVELKPLQAILSISDPDSATRTGYGDREDI